MLTPTNGGKTPGSSDWTSPLRRSSGITVIRSDDAEKQRKARSINRLMDDYPVDVEIQCMAAQTFGSSPFNCIRDNRGEKEEKEKEKELDPTPPFRPRLNPRILFEQEPTESKELTIMGLALANFQIEEESEPNLSELYHHNLDFPDESGNAVEFFAIRTQVEEIEKKLQQPIDLKVSVYDVRERVSGLLLLKNFKLKMAELGVVLFYLDAYRALPEESPLASRAEQIKVEVEHYLSEHAVLCDDPLIPSGKTHYLLRAFSHMVFTSDQAFNKGGLYAIEQLLTDPKFRIAHYLQPEHCDHILIIVRNLCKKSDDFEALFSKNYRVHPDLQDAIRIDLKLRPEEPITSVFVLYAVVMAHFVDIRQMDLPNCYAISAKDFVAKNKTYKSFKFLLQILERGHYDFNHTYIIPAAPLLAQRLAVSQDLARKLPAKNASALIPIGHISSTLDVEPSVTKGRVCTLKETLTHIFEANKLSNKIGYAEQLYYAYKLNALVQLELALLEFVYMNVDLTRDDFGQPYSAPKKELLNACASYIEDNLPKSAPRDNSEFFNHFKEKLAAKIWFENLRFDGIEVTSSKSIKLEGFEITEFQGDIYALEKLLKECSMLFSLHHGEYIPIKSITALQEPMRQAAKEALYDMQQWNRKCPSEKELEAAITSTGFRVEMANYCAAQINKSSSESQTIKGRDLNHADLLLFVQTGGQSPRTLDLVYGMKVRSAEIENCTRAFDFLSNLNTTLKRLDVTLLRAAPKLILRTIGVHAWTVSPSYWEVFFSNNLPFTDFLYEVVYDRANRLLEKTMERPLLVKILQNFTDDQKFIKDVLWDFDHRSKMTRDKFCDWIQRGLTSEQKIRMQKAVDEEFSKISLSDSQLKTLIEKLGIHITENQFGKIFDQMRGRPCLPHQCALHLRRLLIEEGIAIINPYQIELLICEITDLPIWFHLGDLNYMDQYSEDPAHVELGVGFSYFINGLLYYTRDHQTLIPKSSNLPSDVSIVYPK